MYCCVCVYIYIKKIIYILKNFFYVNVSWLRFDTTDKCHVHTVSYSDFIFANIPTKNFLALH